MRTQSEERAATEAELRATVDHELGDEAGTPACAFLRGWPGA
jgi:hypothetical protein